MNKALLSKLTLSLIIMLVLMSILLPLLLISNNQNSANALDINRPLMYLRTQNFHMIKEELAEQTFTDNYESPIYMYLSVGGISPTEKYDNETYVDIVLPHNVTNRYVEYYARSYSGSCIIKFRAYIKDDADLIVINGLPSGYTSDNHAIVSSTTENGYVTTYTNNVNNYYIELPIIQLDYTMYLDKNFIGNYNSWLYKNKGIQAGSTFRAALLNIQSYNTDYTNFITTDYYCTIKGATTQNYRFDNPASITIVQKSITFEYFTTNLVDNVTSNLWLDFYNTIDIVRVRLNSENDFINVEPIYSTDGNSYKFFKILDTDNYFDNILLPLPYSTTSVHYIFGSQYQFAVINEFNIGNFSQVFATISQSFSGFYDILTIKIFGIQLGFLLFLPLFATIILYVVKLIRG